MADASTMIAVCSRSFSANAALRSEILSRYDRVRFNDAGESLSGDGLVDFLNGCTKAIVGIEPLTAAVIERAPDLRVVSKQGIGLDNLDMEAMRAQGIKVSLRSGENRRSVAELVIAAAITMLRDLHNLTHEMRHGTWKPRSGPWLTGKRFGIVGLGSVGRDLVSLLQPFGCEIRATDPTDQAAFCRNNGVEQTGLDDVLATSDIVSLHVPLDPTTHHLIDRERLALMKPGSYLINTSRGGIVDQIALKDALTAGSIGGAALDVFEDEPPTDAGLLALPNLFATPHIAGTAHEAVLAMGMAAIDGLETASVIP